MLEKEQTLETNVAALAERIEDDQVPPFLMPTHTMVITAARRGCVTVARVLMDGATPAVCEGFQSPESDVAQATRVRVHSGWESGNSAAYSRGTGENGTVCVPNTALLFSLPHLHMESSPSCCGLCSGSGRPSMRLGRS